jgi:tRNA(Ile)-lysidine synthase
LRSSASTAFLNFDAFRGDIVVRNRRDGDRFQPFGMSGSKKLKEYLIDKKIPLSLRSALPLFFDQDRLAWIAGYQLSETYRVTPETRRVLRILLTP